MVTMFNALKKKMAEIALVHTFSFSRLLFSVDKHWTDIFECCTAFMTPCQVWIKNVSLADYHIFSRQIWPSVWKYGQWICMLTRLTYLQRSAHEVFTHLFLFIFNILYVFLHIAVPAFHSFLWTFCTNCICSTFCLH